LMERLEENNTETVKGDEINSEYLAN